jgi:hypothetical protein
MIKTIQICTHCKKQVPDKCDGVLYFIKEWGRHRKICKGEMKEDGTWRTIKGKPYYHYVRGHGEEWDVELFNVRSND